MKIKKCFTVFVAGMMTFVTVTCAQVNAYLSQNPVVGAIKEQVAEFWTGLMINGENVMVNLKYLVLHQSGQWVDTLADNPAKQQQMTIELNRSRALCKQSGIWLWPDTAKHGIMVNAPPYRGSG